MHRPYLYALYAFNHEVARVAESVREPMLGAIRLEWWRETVEDAAKGAPRNHDVARGLAALFAERQMPLASLEAIIAARAFDSSAEHFPDFAALETYLDATGGGLMRLAARILGGDPSSDARGGAGLWSGRPAALAAVPQSAAQALSAAGSAGRPRPDAGRILREEERSPHRRGDASNRPARPRPFPGGPRGPRPREALPAVLPAALVPVYLRRIGQECADTPAPDGAVVRRDETAAMTRWHPARPLRLGFHLAMADAPVILELLLGGAEGVVQQGIGVRGVLSCRRHAPLRG